VGSRICGERGRRKQRAERTVSVVQCPVSSGRKLSSETGGLNVVSLRAQGTGGRGFLVWCSCPDRQLRRAGGEEREDSGQSAVRHPSLLSSGTGTGVVTECWGGKDGRARALGHGPQSGPGPFNFPSCPPALLLAAPSWRCWGGEKHRGMTGYLGLWQMHTETKVSKC
jgi:hypothetical protein